MQRLVGELDIHTVDLEKPLTLLNDGVLRLGQNPEQILIAEHIERGDHRNATDEFGNKTVGEQILRLHLGHDLYGVGIVFFAELGAKTQGAPSHPLADDLFQSLESPSADEQNVARVHLNHRLFRMLAPPFGRDIGSGTLQDLEQSLLHALARDIAADRRGRALARDLVHFVQVEDALFGPGSVVIGRLQQPHQDVLDILAHVPRLGQNSRVGDRERHLQHLGQRLGQFGLAHARGADQHHVALFELHIVQADVRPNPLVVIVYRHREDLLGALLANDVLVEEILDLRGFGDDPGLPGKRLLLLLGQHLVAKPDAFVADVHRRTGDDLIHLVGAASAERAARLAFAGTSSHCAHPLPESAAAAASTSLTAAGTMISSIRPYSFASSGPMKKSRSVSRCTRSSGCPESSART